MKIELEVLSAPEALPPQCLALAPLDVVAVVLDGMVDSRRQSVAVAYEIELLVEW